MRWTQPHHGVQHLEGIEAKGIRQITLCAYGGFVEVYALGPVGFTPVWEEDADTIPEAMTKGEAYARQFLPRPLITDQDSHTEAAL